MDRIARQVNYFTLLFLLPVFKKVVRKLYVRHRSTRSQSLKKLAESLFLLQIAKLGQNAQELKCYFIEIKFLHLFGVSLEDQVIK